MEKQNKFVKDMTKGNPMQLLIQFSLPLLVGNIFQQLYNMVDSIIVGNFVGANALGAIGTTNSLNFFFFSLVAGLSVGIGIIVAQYFGFGDEEKVKDAIGNSIWIITVCSVIMAIIGFVTARPIQHLQLFQELKLWFSSLLCLLVQQFQHTQGRILVPGLKTELEKDLILQHW